MNASDRIFEKYTSIFFSIPLAAFLGLVLISLFSFSEFELSLSDDLSGVRQLVGNADIQGNTSAVLNVPLVLSDPVSDSLALVELYNATDGANWADPWPLNQPMDDWNGVSLNGDRCVDVLNLFNQDMTGTLPNLNLPNLVTLRLQNNFLSGAVPDFSNLPMVELIHLGNNAITSIPNFTSMPSLIELNVTQNQLTAPLEDYNLPAMQELFLGFNQISGTVPDFSGMPNLLKLHFQENQVTGTVPEFTMLPNLNQLVINDNLLDTFTIQTSFINSQQAFELISLDNNNLTFDDLITNFNDINFTGSPGNYSYDPQNALVGNVVFNVDPGENILVSSLGFDDTVTTSVYTWFHNGSVYSTGSTQELSIPNAQANDVGIYTINVTNDNVPGLTLEGFSVILNINGVCNPTVDSLALVDLYNSTDGPNWADNTNWLVPGQPIDNWYGVSTSGGCVTCLELDGGNSCSTSGSIGNGLVGTIPASLGNLSELQGLYLSHNNLTGGIPAELGNLSNLTILELDNNGFLGDTIPKELGSLSQLTLLELNDCALTGSLPDSLSNLTLLEGMFLFNNQLSGEIPASYNNLTSLTTMTLFDNFLSGAVPDLTNVPLVECRLENNQLTDLANLSSIGTWGSASYQGLKVEVNRMTFEDILPNMSIFNLPADNSSYAPQDSFYSDTIITVSVGDDLIIDLGIDASVPDNFHIWIKNGFPYVETGPFNELSFTGITLSDAGVYNAQVTNPNAPLLTLNSRLITLVVLACDPMIDSLALVDLYNMTDGANWTNSWTLTDPISTWYGVGFDGNGCINCLDLDGDTNCDTGGNTGNNLVGTIPPSLGNISELQGLYLSHNNLTGGIPVELGNLSNLAILELDNNTSLGDTIPKELGRLSQLIFLELNNNNHIGSIPDSLGNLQNLIGLFLFNNLLSGEIPASLNNLTNLRDLTLFGNQLSGAVPDLTGIPGLEECRLKDNQLTGLADLSSMTSWGPASYQGLEVENNQLTFEDILPSILVFNDFPNSSYAPQDSFYTDTIITVNVGDDLTIDLGIDASVPDNDYNWYKDGIFHTNTTIFNALNFTGITLGDAGVYHVQVTNPNAPLLTLFSRSITLNVLACNPTSDSLALVELYDNTTGNNWTDNANWKVNGMPISSWEGIKVNNDGCVDTIRLVSNNLDGSLPDLNLPYLRSLRLQSNSLNGSIPNFIFLDSLIHLNLATNQLTGNMENYNLPSLVNLFFSDNQLSGTIPDFTGMPNLVKLHFHTNDITGIVPNFSALPNLGELSIYTNNLDSFAFQNTIAGSGQELTLIQADTNNFTFDDLIMNLSDINLNGTFSYASQALIYQEESILTIAGDNLIIDLLIDDTVTTNRYEWFKNGVPYDTIFGDNQLIFPNISRCDTGTYTVQVTNPNAPLLTLLSHPINVAVSCPFNNTPLTSTICQGESYIVGDSTYTETGMYNNTFNSYLCCDSTVTLDLTVLPAPVTDLGTVSICEGDSYMVGDSIYSLEGVYQNVLQTMSGCDSIVDLNLIVNAPTNSDLGAVFICEGDSYMVGDSTYTISGNYATVLQNINGCDSTVDLTLTVLDTSLVNISATICENESYMVGNSTYNSNGSHVTVLQNVNNCDSTVVLNLTVLDTAITNITTSICADETFMVGDSTYTMAGSYTNILQTFQGCDSTVNLFLTVFDTANITIDTSICAGDMIMIGNTSHTVSGMYSDTIMTLQGCDSIINLNLTVFDTVSITVDTSICAGETYTVGSSIYDMSGTYTDILQTIQGCDSIVHSNLIVFPAIALSEIDTSICEGETIVIGTTSINSSGTYVEVLTNENGCDSTVMLNLSVISESITGISDAGEDMIVCESIFTLTANQPPNTTGVWTGPAGVYIEYPDSSITFIDQLQAGENLFTWTLSTNGCPDYSSDEVIITLDTLSPKPADDNFATQTGFPLTEIDILDNDELYSRNDWAIEIINHPITGLLELDNDSFPDIYTPESGFTGTETFEYKLCNFNCPDYCNDAIASIEIRPYLEEGTEVNIIITPNGDGLNDLLVFDNLDKYPENELLIVNRWGSLIYTSKPYNNDWYGQNQNGNVLPEGTYYFIMRLSIGKGKLIWGSVTVNR